MGALQKVVYVFRSYDNKLLGKIKKVLP